jgi:hypothetical protein
MDDIDRAKIGRKDEKLVGWDHIRRPAETNLPPMKAKGVDDKYNWLLSPYRGKSKEQKNQRFSWGWFLFFIICLVIIVTKIFGVW